MIFCSKPTRAYWRRGRPPRNRSGHERLERNKIESELTGIVVQTIWTIYLFYEILKNFLYLAIFIRDSLYLRRVVHEWRHAVFHMWSFFDDPWRRTGWKKALKYPWRNIKRIQFSGLPRNGHSLISTRRTTKRALWTVCSKLWRPGRPSTGSRRERERLELPEVKYFHDKQSRNYRPFKLSHFLWVGFDHFCCKEHLWGWRVISKNSSNPKSAQYESQF